MTLSTEDVLGSLCSEVALSHANDFQKVYTLATPLEAKLAFEVLVAFGLDVKVYHQADKPSKLYITNPTFSDAQLQKIYASAMAYAKTLKQIKGSLESLCADNEALFAAIDYNIALHKGQGQAKQIVIQILPSAEAHSLALQSDTPPAAAPSISAPAPSSASVSVAASQPRAAAKKSGGKPKSHYEELSSGPAVGRGNYPGKLSAEGEAQQNSLRRQMTYAVFGNMTTSTFAMCVMAVIAGVLLSVFVMLKGFLCPDLAVANKNRAWYCSYGDAPPPQKPQQQTLSPR
ncbi:MAG: hypothetical protein K2Q01_09860 [Rickettsiales bacterium]|nr:hypothetical protein [Rickettsiales bacterium]